MEDERLDSAEEEEEEEKRLSAGGSSRSLNCNSLRRRIKGEEKKSELHAAWERKERRSYKITKAKQSSPPIP